MHVSMRSDVQYSAHIHTHTHTNTYAHRRVFHNSLVLKICVPLKQNLFSSFNNRRVSVCVCVCVGYLCQRTRGRGWARMEMFGGCREHEGWVDCWVMSHWSLLQSLLSNLNTPSNTRAGRSTGIWACGWKSWVGSHIQFACTWTTVHTLSSWGQNLAAEDVAPVTKTFTVEWKTGACRVSSCLYFICVQCNLLSFHSELLETVNMCFAWLCVWWNTYSVFL